MQPGPDLLIDFGVVTLMSGLSESVRDRDKDLERREEDQRKTSKRNVRQGGE